MGVGAKEMMETTRILEAGRRRAGGTDRPRLRSFPACLSILDVREHMRPCFWTLTTLLKLCIC